MVKPGSVILIICIKKPTAVDIIHSQGPELVANGAEEGERDAALGERDSVLLLRGKDCLGIASGETRECAKWTRRCGKGHPGQGTFPLVSAVEYWLDSPNPLNVRELFIYVAFIGNRNNPSVDLCLDCC